MSRRVRPAAVLLALLAIAGAAQALEYWPRVFVRVAHVPIDLQTPDGIRITVLDARKRNAYLRGHIRGAQLARWTRYRAGWLRSGRLPDDLEKLARELGKLGVDDDKPVLVCGNGRDGWGEEGRIAWMIRYLGHPAVAVLDGGCEAWRDAGRPVTEAITAPMVGTFTARPRNELRAFTPELIAALDDDSVQLLDVRTPEEFNGATPYFSSRGGHIPTAVNIPFRSFFDDRGQVKERHVVEALLEGMGLTQHGRIIVYCTGGVRSAFVAEILRTLGVDASNFDASFWAWSADHALPVNRSDG